MTWFSLILFVSFVSVTIVIIQQTSSVSTNNQKNLNPDEPLSFRDKHSWITHKSQGTIDQLRCPGNWSRFNDSCYSLSDIWSTARQANDTCNRFQLNNSRLMYIQRPIELFYAAHVLIKNDLNKLVLEVDQNLMKNAKIINMLSSNFDVQWEKFGKRILQDTSYADKTIHRESTTVPGDEINNGNKDHNKFENVDHLHKPCHQIKWNVVNEDSNTLILTVELVSNESICSLSNADLRVAYPHLCQYVLDLCLNNMICGKHGLCVNSQSSFNCSCSFLYAGLFCDEFSINDIQLLIAFPILLIAPLLLFTTTRNLLRDAFKWLIKHLRRQKKTSPSPQDDQNDEQNGQQSIQNQQALAQHFNNHATRNMRIEFNLSPREQWIRFILVLILSFVLFSILFGIPTIRYLTSAKMNDANSYKLDSLINNRSHMSQQYERNTIFRIDNFIFLIISIVLSIIFSYLNTQDQSDDNNQSRIIEPIKPFYVTDRYKTAAIVTIQMFEILEILNETLIDISEASQSGIFVKIFKRMIFVIINGFRYYPVLASLQFQDIRVRFLTFVYAISNMVYTIIRENSYVYWLPFSNNISSLKQTNYYIDMNRWSFVYIFAKNGLYCLLIGYIGAELIVRLFYDSIYIALMKGRSILEIPYRKIDKYSVLKLEASENQGVSEESTRYVTNGGNNIAQNDNSNQQGYWFRIRKCIINQFRKFRIYATKIYKWEDDFRYTTIVICTYTILFIFLLHLTCNLIFLYTTENNNYINYLKRILKRILDIEIKERSFKGEVVFSASITMIFFGSQLLHSIKNYKNCMRKLYKEYNYRTESGIELNRHEIIPKSVQYPAFILRYLLGGFVICFNLILFIVTISNVIRTRDTSFKWTLISVISVIFVYGLHRVINLAANKLFTSYNPRNQNDLRLNRPYSILWYFNLISTSFIGIISSIIRLIISVLVNILFLPRIDYSCLVQPLQKLDSAHVAFQCFIRWELLYRPDMRFEVSNIVETTSTPGAPSIRETTAETVQEDEYEDAENNENPDDNTSTSEQLSLLSQRRSSNRVDEPMVSNTRSDSDRALETSFLPVE